MIEIIIGMEVCLIRIYNLLFDLYCTLADTPLNFCKKKKNWNEMNSQFDRIVWICSENWTIVFSEHISLYFCKKILTFLFWVSEILKKSSWKKILFFLLLHIIMSFFEVLFFKCITYYIRLEFRTRLLKLFFW